MARSVTKKSSEINRYKKMQPPNISVCKICITAKVNGLSNNRGLILTVRIILLWWQS